MEPIPDPRHSETVVRNSLWGAADVAAGLVAGFISSIAVARILGPEKLGYYNYVLFIINATGTLGNYGITMAARKHIGESIGANRTADVIRIVQFISRFQLLLALAVQVLALWIVLTQIGEQHRWYAVLAVLSLAPNLLLVIPTSVNMALQDFSANVVASLAAITVNLAGMVLSLTLGWDLVGLAGAMLLSRTVDLSIRYPLYKSRFAAWLRAQPNSGEPADPTLSRRLWQFSLQATLLQVLNVVVWDRSELFFLERFRNVTEVAFYSTPFMITQQLLLVPQIFASAAGANLMQRMGVSLSEARGVAALTVRYVALLAFPLTFGMAAVGVPLVEALYGARYQPAGPVLTILALFTAVKALMLPAQQLLIAADRQRFVVKVTLVAAAVKIGMDLLLIPGSGAIGAAIANSAAQTIAACLLWAAAVKGLRVALPSAHLLKMFGATATMAGLVWSVATLLGGPVTGLAVAVPLGALAYIALLRWTVALDDTDSERLTKVGRLLPALIERWYQHVVHFVVPCPKPASSV